MSPIRETVDRQFAGVTVDSIQRLKDISLETDDEAHKLSDIE